MLNLTAYALQDLHQHKDFRSIYLCYLNHVQDCQKQNDAEALRLRYRDKLATCKEEHNLVATSKVPEAERVGAADMLTGEIDLRVEVSLHEEVELCLVDPENNVPFVTTSG